MEETILPYSIDQACWTPPQLGVPTPDQLAEIAEILVGARRPLLLTGYTGRERSSVAILVDLADTLRGLQVLDVAGADMCFPADHPAWLSVRYGEHDAILEADVILVVECDVRTRLRNV